MSTPQETREQLAALAHAQWSGWITYMLSRCVTHPDGSVLIPTSLAERWRRQMSTPYAQLPESEKESDRTEADKVIALIALLASEHGGAH